MKTISFNVPPFLGTEQDYISKAINNKKICGNGEFSRECDRVIENITGTKKALITTSGTSALEMASILSEIQPGDEVIMPSFTFVSTANAFVLRGAKIVFVDIRPDTMNIDENLIEDAVTARTKAIVPVHYAGVACEMDKICEIAKSRGLTVVEDAAQGFMSFYKDRALGSIGEFGCYSFHETKNYASGEGGALLVNREQDVERAEIVLEKGTNRSKFFRGQVDKYTWVDVGSSFIQSELNCAYLYAQIKDPNIINENRLASWNRYYNALKELEERGRIVLPVIPEGCRHNAHMFYIKTKNMDERTRLIAFLKQNGIFSAFHYIPLHTSPAGQEFGRFHGEDRYTTAESERLTRLPMYYGLEEADIDYICSKIYDFYR